MAASCCGWRDQHRLPGLIHGAQSLAVGWYASCLLASFSAAQSVILLSKCLLPDNAGQGHTPIPSPRWHDLEGQARADAIGRLRDWVRRVYVPVYGHLAAGMAACWPEHPLALQILDHLSETWAVLYARPTRPQRVLTAQLEFQLRYVPAAAEMLQRETSGCEHQARVPPSTRGRPGGCRHG